MLLLFHPSQLQAEGDIAFRITWENVGNNLARDKLVVLKVRHWWFWIQECKQVVIELKIHGGVLAGRWGVLQVDPRVKHLCSPDFCAQKQASLSDETDKTKKYTISKELGNNVQMQNTLSGRWEHLKIPTGHISDLGRQPAGKVLDSPTGVPT